ncbi:unnamed protein product [Microthlaspi erraticum]|uniref:CRAL-TRIO domain-containing protein n=1 Tax=Microthlaspi erraticum TaxID=1685480 RepID=A0A6D2KG38_9BRAS|nr:unnamed protein product [Microthlaspi erraticum]
MTAEVKVDLKEYQRNALRDLKRKLEEAIVENTSFEKKREREIPVKGEKEKKTKDTAENYIETLRVPLLPSKGAQGTDVCLLGARDFKVIWSNLKTKLEEAILGDIVFKNSREFHEDIELWGVPLLPSKGAEGTDVILLKFLRTREFKVNEALEMLKKTLKWRKHHMVDSVLGEDFGKDLASAAYKDGVDREHRPVCYNVHEFFENKELYKKTYGSEESKEKLLRWRCQLLEKGIKKLELKPGGVTTLLQIHDLKHACGFSTEDLINAVIALQENYPGFVSRHVFINAPFLFCTLMSLISPFLVQRTKSKIVVARPADVTETLLKYITAEQIPFKYGGFRREDDTEFSLEAVSELVVAPGSTETIEILAPEAQGRLVWDIAVLGWDVNYKEEFEPTDERAYTIIVKKEKTIASNEGPMRNSFKNKESGKIVLTVENVSSNFPLLGSQHLMAADVLAVVGEAMVFQTLVWQNCPLRPPLAVEKIPANVAAGSLTMTERIVRAEA